MANRAYLYTATNDFSKLRDVSEYRSDVPLWYKILLGINTQQANSRLWNYEHPIAIVADFKAGLSRLIAFYEYLSTQEGLDKNKLLSYKADTEAFFEKHPDRALDLFFMEGGEAYDLIASEKYTIEQENEYICLHTRSISSAIANILSTKPANVFDLEAEYTWLKEIKADLSILEPYWTHVTYFSFNKT